MLDNIIFSKLAVEFLSGADLKEHNKKILIKICELLKYEIENKESKISRLETERYEGREMYRKLRKMNLFKLIKWRLKNGI